MRPWLQRLLGETTSPATTETAGDELWLDAAYWMILGRPPDEHGRRSIARLVELGQPTRAARLQLLSSTEFRIRHHALRAGEAGGTALEALEPGLASLGPDEAFVELAYSCLLDRPPDAEGRAAYLEHLARGEPRAGVVTALLRSDEFAARYLALCPAGGVIPYDTQLCELANPAKWDNPEWLAVLRELRLPAEHKLAMHRKAYEFTQTVWGLRRLGVLDDRASVLSVGAGHESLAYSLANITGHVTATDLYEGKWQSACAAEGDLRVLTHPEEFAPFPYRRDRLRFLQMNGCHLGFKDGSFDVAYSLSSVEHFGGWTGARAAVQEMGRVLRPGGILALATEWILSGPSREELFLPDEVARLIDVPGLELVEPIDDRVWRRYSGAVVDLRRNRHETPHMVLKIDDTTFTTVFVFLRKVA